MAACIPEIARDDYEAFRKILERHVPETYDDWVKLATKLHDDAVAGGKDAISVEVKAEEFSRYLENKANTADPKGLCKFAREKNDRHGKKPAKSDAMIG